MSDGLSGSMNSALDYRVQLVGVGLALSLRQEGRPHPSVTKAQQGQAWGWLPRDTCWRHIMASGQEHTKGSLLEREWRPRAQHGAGVCPGRSAL